MKNINIFFLLTLFLTFTYTCYGSLSPKKGENYYIYVKSVEGGKSNPEFNKHIQSYIDQFGKVIIDNLDTYENKSELEQFQKEFKPVDGEVGEIHKYSKCTYGYTLKDEDVFMAHLNKNIIDQIESIPGVLEVEASIKVTYAEPVVPKEEDEYIKCSERQKQLGYPCCKKDNKKVYYTDADGEWGYDFKKKEWCGLTVETTVTPMKGANYYIYVKSVEGGKSNPEFNKHIQSYIDQFGKIIIDNLDSYENKSELEQFQKEFKPVDGEVSEIRKYSQCTYGYTLKDEDVFMVHLNGNIIEKILSVPGVLDIEAGVKIVNNDPVVPQVTPKKGAKYYIYVKSVEGGKSNPEFNKHVQSYIDQFGKIIIDNLDTYEDKSELEQFKNEFQPVDGEVSEIRKYSQCTYGYTVGDEDVFMAYLNENVIEQVKSISGVLEVEPSIKIVNDDPIVPSVTPKKGAKYYIYVKSVEGGKSNPEFNKHVQSYIDQFGKVIIDNLDSYEDKSELEQFKNEFQPVDGEVSEIRKYSQCTYGYTVGDEDVFMAYLNENVIEQVKSISGVLEVEPSIKIVNDDPIVPSVTPKKGAKYYIYVKSVEGGKSNPEFNKHVQSYIDQFGKVIVDNLDTYEDKSELEQFQKEFQPVEGEVSEIRKYSQCTYGYTVGDEDVFMAYLNENVIEQIKSISGVLEVEPSIKIVNDDPVVPQVTPKKGAKYYIYVKSVEGGKSNPEFNKHVQSYIDQFGKVIIDNLESYEDKSELEQFKNEFQPVEGEVSEIRKYSQCTYGYTVGDEDVFMAYLNENVIEQIKSISGVLEVEPSIKIVNDDPIVSSVTPKKGAKYYIYVKSVEGGKSNPEFNKHVQSYIDQFGKVIVDNLDTYEDKSELEQFKNEFQPVEGEVSEIRKYSQCTYGYTVGDEDVFMAYLNENVIEQIKSISGVLEVEPSIKIVNDDPVVPQVTPKKGAKYYIYVKSVEGGKSNPEFNKHVQSYIDQFGKVIIDNLDTYENVSELEQFKNEFQPVEGEVSEIRKYSQCTYGYTVGDEDVFMAYLNENVIEQIKSISGVLEVEPSIKIVNDDPIVPQVTPKKGAKYYIYVKSVEGGKSNPEFNKHVQSYIDQFGKVIIDNLESYEDKSELEQFKNEFQPVEGEVSEIRKYSQCTYGYSLGNEDVFMAYLNENIIEQISSISGVLEVEPSIKIVNDDPVVPQVTPKKGAKYYIYVKSVEGGKSNPEFNKHVQSYIDQFGEIILANIDSYEDKSELEQFQKEFQPVEGEVSEIRKYSQCTYGYTVGDEDVFMAYLNENIIELVQSISGVLEVESPIKIVNDDPVIPNEEEDEYVKCSEKQKELGYSCCKKDNKKVYYSDADGDWGYDFKKDEWCGLSSLKDATVVPMEGADYYIYVKSVEGGKSSPEFNKHVQSYIDQFGKIIIDNLDSYENKSELEQFKKEFKPVNGEDVKEIHRYSKSSYLYTLQEEDVFMAHLNGNIVSKISSIPGVLAVETGYRVSYEYTTVPQEDGDYARCSEKQKQLGYPCCKKDNTRVYYSDADGDWGYDFNKKEWCGLASADATVTPKKGGIYYIYVKSVEGGKKNPEFNKHIQSYIDQFGEIILANIDSYEDKSELEQFQKEFKPMDGEVKEIRKYSKSSYLYTVTDEDLFVAYLNGNILSEVSSVPGVIVVESPVDLTFAN